ncbi:hypothetical protein OG252_25335 [Streptomyces sp. NBC_01352]|uniref:Uncharacterized protein n=1 Tax=Streptomyces plumbiresistens TaxID=511811 RepID=A0ABP7QZE7_9ACTN|nr:MULTISPECIES: hypothetical protein [unclassified Streptomyces]MCX4699337.1 hypothetical protein [Streptomyces sp. NBC_01373]
MSSTASQPSPAAGGGHDCASPEFAHANHPPRDLYVGVLSGGQDISLAGWLRIGYQAIESKAAVAAWAEFQEALYTDPALNIRRGDTLRARKLAAGQGRTRFPSTRRGPTKAEQWGYRHVLRRGLDVIAGLPGTTVGTARSRGGAHAATADALLSRLSAHHAAEGTSALAVLRTNTAASWYELTPAPSAVDPRAARELPYVSAGLEAGLDGLLEAAEFVAYCAYQHHARRRNRRFLWDWFPELLPGAEGPLEL